MPDINEWVLAVPGSPDFEFGSIGTSDYPMSTQVVIGDADADLQDQRHPTSDGVVMGKDTFGGFEITFDMKILPQEAAPDLWTPSLDLFSPLKTAWRADAIRRVPGAYATLRNLDRGRMVYGRPRKCTPSLARVRKGIIGCVSTFDTNGPDWYGLTEHAVTITPDPAEINKITTPITSPITTASSEEETAEVVNAGDVNAWPVIDFYGPGSYMSLTLFDGATPMWKVWINGSIAAGQYLRLDTRPWSRSAQISTGVPANGRMRGDRVEDLFIPPGGFDATFKTTDPTGVSKAIIKWHDAYASI